MTLRGIDGKTTATHTLPLREGAGDSGQSKVQNFGLKNIQKCEPLTQVRAADGEAGMSGQGNGERVFLTTGGRQENVSGPPPSGFRLKNRQVKGQAWDLYQQKNSNNCVPLENLFYLEARSQFPPMMSVTLETT